MSDTFFWRSDTGDANVAWLPTFPAGLLEVEWAGNFHVSFLLAISTVLIIIDW